MRGSERRQQSRTHRRPEAKRGERGKVESERQRNLWAQAQREIRPSPSDALLDHAVG